MPLINSSSNKERSENIATEIKAGKDPKQAAAIAYSVQRKNKDESIATDCEIGDEVRELISSLSSLIAILEMQKRGRNA